MRRLLLCAITMICLCSNSSSQNAQNFKITDSQDNEHDLFADYLDSNYIVLIDFFFIDCPFCHPYNPILTELYNKYKDEGKLVQFFSLSIREDDTNAEVQQYLEEYAMPYPGAGSDGGAYKASLVYQDGFYGTFFGAPTFVLIAPDRSVVFDLASNGEFETEEEVVDEIEKTINQIRQDFPIFQERTTVKIDVQSYTDAPLPNYTIFMRSADVSSKTFVMPDSFIYPSLDFPQLNNPEIYLEIIQPNNSNLTAYDLSTVQKHILGIEPLNGFLEQAADVNNSGTVTAADLMGIQRVILQSNNFLPNNRSYFGLNAACAHNRTECVQSVLIDQTLDTQLIKFEVLRYGDVINH